MSVIKLSCTSSELVLLLWKTVFESNFLCLPDHCNYYCRGERLKFLSLPTSSLLQGFIMTLKDLLKKKDKLRASEHGRNGSLVEAPPNITITRSDTTTNEILFPHPPAAPMVEEKLETGRSRRFRSLSNASSSNASKESKGEKRISQILHLRSHSHDSSVHVPTSLPSIDPANQSHEETEAQWEARATLLAKENFNRPHGIFPGENPAVFSEKTGTLEIETPEGRNRPRRVDDASSNV